MYLKPKKGNPFRRSLPVYAIIGIPLGYIGKSSQPSSVDPLFINESIFKNRLQLDVCTKKCASNNTRFFFIFFIFFIFFYYYFFFIKRA